jgi:solute carrier family 6 GABA transporter-like protein 1
VLQLVTWENLVYQGYHYPWWAHAIGYFMAGSSMICIPAYAAWLWFTTPGTTQEVFK